MEYLRGVDFMPGVGIRNVLYNGVRFNMDNSIPCCVAFYRYSLLEMCLRTRSLWPRSLGRQHVLSSVRIRPVWRTINNREGDAT